MKSSKSSKTFKIFKQTIVAENGGGMRNKHNIDHASFGNVVLLKTKTLLIRLKHNNHFCIDHCILVVIMHFVPYLCVWLI